MKKIDEMLEKIEASKEVLETLPKNNEKNINNYLKKIEEVQKEYEKKEQDIQKEMLARYEQVEAIQRSKEIDSLQQELENNEGVLYLLNEIETSFEKMDFDKALQNLSYYYKKNLEVVNSTILFCLNKFKEVGINLTLEDFNYSPYVTEYFSTFLSEVEKVEDTSSEKIKAKFDEIYWKCPDIITHIELNLRYLYLKNEKEIDKYYNKQKEVLLKKFTVQELIDKYFSIKRKLEEVQQQDKGEIVHQFLEGKLNIKDYDEKTIQGYYTRLISADVLKENNEEKIKEISQNMKKLVNSLYEYKNYLKFQFIMKNIQEKYKEKDKYKNIYAETRKQITAKENKILKMNKKINGKGLFGKKVSQNEKIQTEQNNIILEIKELYKKLEEDKVYQKIYSKLNDNSSLSDVLYLVSCFYKYLFNCIKDEKKEMPENEIEEFIEELREFRKWPYCTLLNNIGILEEKDLLLIIKDKYQLLNINLTKEDLQEDNIDYLINIIKAIILNDNIKKNNMTVQEIEEMCELKKILQK